MRIIQAFNTEEELMQCFLNLKKYPNVIGIDGELQPKIKNGLYFDNLRVIRVYVTKKIPKDKFKDRNILSKLFNNHLTLDDIIPEKINGFFTDIVEMGEVCALEEVIGPRPVILREKTQLRYRPLQSGISCTHYQSTACTLNGLFIENGTGRLLMASNCHCFGRENTAKIGDPILQPSPYDGGIVYIDKVGEFYKSVNIKFIQSKSRLKNLYLKLNKTFKSEEAFFNRVDISFASFNGCTKCPKCNPITNACLVKVYNIGLPIGKRLPNINEKVRKIGRTTGLTFGTVISTSWTGTVKYSRGTATFIDCILVSGRNFSLGGDSGSPCLDMEGNYLGALFGGANNHGIVCKASNIEIEGNVELVVLPPEIIKKIVKKKRKR